MQFHIFVDLHLSLFFCLYMHVSLIYKDYPNFRESFHANQRYFFAAGATLVVDDGWRLIVRAVRVEDTRAQYSCSVLDNLTGERRRSTPVSIDVAREYAIWELSRLHMTVARPDRADQLHRCNTVI